MKIIYIILGFLSLAIGIIGIFLPLLPTTPFYYLLYFSSQKVQNALEQWFLGTSIYQKHLKSFHENRSLKKNTKIFYFDFCYHNATNWFLFHAKCNRA
ncbi:Inner membrane protein ybaN [Haemophilus influenzae]|uniref:Inner membrane protein ybaN n=1 Tax=Haemophilus influenzae TaxID=727 RepID=A0A2X1PM39_HAEIF|nr:Inner membrane protein ybaN [Haemophilus influenzae]